MFGLAYLSTEADAYRGNGPMETRYSTIACVDAGMEDVRRI